MVNSVMEPLQTGTRTLPPVIFPFNAGKIIVIAFAAPVEVGIIELAAARALIKSL